MYSVDGTYYSPVAKEMMYHMFSVCFQVLGIPWDIDTEGLRQYMLKFGDLDDVIVMKVSYFLKCYLCSTYFCAGLLVYMFLYLFSSPLPACVFL